MDWSDYADFRERSWLVAHQPIVKALDIQPFFALCQRFGEIRRCGE